MKVGFCLPTEIVNYDYVHEKKKVIFPRAFITFIKTETL